MDYRRFGDTIIARMDKGEEIVEQVRCIALKENIKLASVEVYTHLHMSAADVEARVFGGHLVDATSSATGEMVIRILEGCVDRKFSEEVGLNLFEF